MPTDKPTELSGTKLNTQYPLRTPQMNVHPKFEEDSGISFPGNGQKPPFWVIIGHCKIEQKIGQRGPILNNIGNSLNKCTHEVWRGFIDEFSSKPLETTIFIDCVANKGPKLGQRAKIIKSCLNCHPTSVYTKWTELSDYFFLGNGRKLRMDRRTHGYIHARTLTMPMCTRLRRRGQ